MINGVFDGVIVTSGEEFHVEIANKFFREKRDFHSVIYRTSDIVFEQNEASCAAKEGILNHLKELQATAQPIKHTRKETPSHKRQKRAFTVSGGTFCQVLVAVDHTFHDAIGDNNEAVTISEVVTVFSEVQNIFKNTDFDDDGTADNIVPLIARIEIMLQTDEGYRFGSTNIGVSSFLDLWSQENHNEFCLALLLTYRDFDGGVLGLAWVAQPDGGNRGGICEDRVRLSIGERNLNTAIVTFLNFGNRQPRSVTVITIAHEFGHNFGAPVSVCVCVCVCVTITL